MNELKAVMADSQQPGPESSFGGLKDLMGLGLKTHEPWQPEELRVLLQDELSSPLEFDLSGLDNGEARRLLLRARAQGLLVRSLGELFQHPKPPLDLLTMAKDYFKLNQSHPKSDLPPDVALGLYYLCIAIALWRHHQRITSLGRDELTAAFRWVQSQEWMDAPSKQAATEAAKVLTESE
jgi:hypothetical protein